MKLIVLGVCAFLFLQLSGLATAAKICGLDGYDVTHLAQADYWTVDLKPAVCTRPSHVPEKNVTGCVIHFSFCHPLPVSSKVCPDLIESNTSVCESVSFSNGATTFVASYGLGQYSTEHDFHPKSFTSYDGFESVWNGSLAENVTQCQGNFSIVMVFTCETTSLWALVAPNVTQYMTHSTVSGCETMLYFNYEGACYSQPTLAPANCELQPYDISFLALQEYSYVTVKDCFGMAPTCDIYFSFCHALPPNITETCNGAAICMVTKSGEESVSYSLGHFENYTLFRNNDNTQEPGFNVDWKSGSYTDKCLTGLETNMILVCDPNSDWPPSPTEADRTTYLKGVNHDELCLFTFVFSYSGACAPPCPAGWTGPHGNFGFNCNEDIDECTKDTPCQNGATCSNTDGSYVCICTSGYTGFNCDVTEECSDRGNNIGALIGTEVAAAILLVIAVVEAVIIAVLVFRLRVPKKSSYAVGMEGPHTKQGTDSKLLFGTMPPEDDSD